MVGSEIVSLAGLEQLAAEESMIGRNLRGPELLVFAGLEESFAAVKVAAAVAAVGDPVTAVGGHWNVVVSAQGVLVLSREFAGFWLLVLDRRCVELVMFPCNGFPVYSHVSVQYPVQIFFPFFWPAWPTSDLSEECGLPLHAFLGSLSGLFSLPIFDLGLLVGGEYMVSVFDG